MGAQDDLRSVLGLRKEDEHDFNGNSTQKRTLFQRCIRSTFMLLYLISKDSRTSFAAVCLMALTNMFQLLYFAFRVKDFHWPVDLATWVSTKLQIFTFDFGPIFGDQVVVFAFLFFSMLLITVFTLSFWISFTYSSKGTAEFIWLLPILRLLMRLLTSVLYVPTLSALLKVFSCGNELELILPCNSALRTTVIVAVSILVAFFVTFNCIAQLVFVENNPCSRNYLAQAHGRVDTSYLLVKAAVSVLFATLANTPNSSFILMLTVLLSGLWTTFSYLIFLPYHKHATNCVFVSTNAVYLWSGICLLSGEVIALRSDYDVALTFFMGAPFVVISFVYFTGVRERSLEACSLQKHTPTLRAELILRYQLKPSQETWPTVGSEYRRLVEECFPRNAFLLLQLANMYEFCGLNELLSGQFVRRAQSLPCALDQRYMIFQYFNRQQQKTHGAQGALSYVSFNHHTKRAEKMILDTVKEFVSFWKMVQKKSFTPDDVSTTASKIFTKSSQARVHLDKLILLAANPAKPAKLYEVYALEILKDKRLASRLRRISRNLQEAHSDVSSANVAQVTISGNEEDLGIVLEASESLSCLFGIPGSQVIGHNISTLTPPPFDRIHDEFLQKYIETNKEMVTVKRRIWGLHKRGYTTTMDLYVTPTLDNNGLLRFDGKFVKVLNAPDFVMLEHSGRIQFFSEGMMRDFGLKDVSTLDVEHSYISQFIPELGASTDTDLLDRFSEGGTLQLQHGSVYTILSRPVQFHTPQTEIDLVMMTFTPVTNDNEQDDLEDGGSQSDSDGQSVQGKQGWETNSVGSESSVGTYVAQSTQQQQNGLEATEEAQDSKLRGFWRILCLLIFCSMLLGATVLSLEVYFYTEFESLLVAVRRSGKRAALIGEINILLLEQANNVSAIDPSNANNTALLMLEMYADELAHVHDLLVSSPESQNGVIPSISEDQNLVRETLDGVHYTTLSLNVGILKLITSARKILERNERICSDSCAYILNNGPYELLDIALESLSAYNEQAMYNLQNSRMVILLCCAGSSCVGIYLVLLKVFTVLKEIKRMKHQMAQALRQIPESLVNDLYRKSVSKFKSTKRAVEGTDGQANAREESDHASLFRDDENARSSQETSDEAKPVTLMLSKKSTKVVPEEKLALRRRQTYFRARQSFKVFCDNCNLELLLNSLRMCLPALCLLAYLVYVYFYADALNGRLAGYADTLYATCKLWTVMERMLYSAKAEYAFNSIPPAWSRWYNDPAVYNETNLLGEYVHTLDLLNHAVLYGNDTLHTEPFTKKGKFPQYYAHHFANACVTQLCLSLLKHGDEERLVKDLSHGLGLALEQLISLAKTKNKLGLYGEPKMATRKAVSEAIERSIEIMHVALVDNILRQEQKLTIYATVVFLLLLLLISNRTYRKYRKLVQDITYCRYMLFMLPPEVYSSVPAMDQLKP